MHGIGFNGRLPQEGLHRGRRVNDRIYEFVYIRAINFAKRIENIGLYQVVSLGFEAVEEFVFEVGDFWSCLSPA